MALTIPDYAAASHPDLAGPDSVDFDAIVAGINNVYVAAGCQATQRGAGANLSVDVTAGVIGLGSGIQAVSSGNVAVTADTVNPRFVLIVSSSAGVLSAVTGVAAATPSFPAIPASSVLLAAVFVAANATQILNADIIDKRVAKTAPETVSSGSATGPVITSYGRTAVEVRYGVDTAGSQFSDSADGDWVTRLADTTKTMRWGVSAVGGASDVRLTASALTVTAGTDFVVGTKAIKTGVKALAATANTATALGQFSTTAGSMALRLHLDLVTGTVQRTKTYEFVVDVATDTTNTYYYVLPADQSTAQATTSDVILVCYRPSTATTTWQFWICSSATFASTGAVTWTAESYGDTVVTFASALSPATTAPALPFVSDATHVKYHPSNTFDTVAGRIGVNTDNPGQPIDVWASDTNAAIMRLQNTGTGDAGLILAPSSLSGGVLVGSGASAHGFSDSIIGDINLGAVSGQTLRLGAGVSSTSSSATASLLRLGTDVQINDNGTARSVPRGFIGQVTLTANYTPTAAITNRVLASSASAVAVIVSGRRYKITFNHYAGVSATGTWVSSGTVLLNSASIAQGGTPAGTVMCAADLDCGQNAGAYQFGTVATQTFVGGTDIAAGSYFIIMAAASNSATPTTTWGGGTTPASTRNIAWIEDIGT